MSVIQLSANHICAVAVGVTKLLNNVPAVNYVFLKDNTRDALNAAFKDCKGESKYSLYPYEEANVFTLLAGINARAAAHTLGKRKNKKAEAKAPAFLFVV